MFRRFKSFMAKNKPLLIIGVIIVSLFLAVGSVNADYECPPCHTGVPDCDCPPEIPDPPRFKELKPIELNQQ